MSRYKYINGKKVELTPEEITAMQAAEEQAEKPLATKKDHSCGLSCNLKGI